MTHLSTFTFSKMFGTTTTITKLNIFQIQNEGKNCFCSKSSLNTKDVLLCILKNIFLNKYIFRKKGKERKDDLLVFSR